LILQILGNGLLIKRNIERADGVCTGAVSQAAESKVVVAYTISGAHVNGHRDRDYSTSAVSRQQQAARDGPIRYQLKVEGDRVRCTLCVGVSVIVCVRVYEFL